jgi:hypothetical protein
MPTPTCCSTADDTPDGVAVDTMRATPRPATCDADADAVAGTTEPAFRRRRAMRSCSRSLDGTDDTEDNDSDDELRLTLGTGMPSCA